MSTAGIRPDRTSVMQSTQIGVVGGGLMGHGIGYLLAMAGHTVGIYETSSEVRAGIAARVRAIADLLGNDPSGLARISVHDALPAAVKDATFVFEAAPEKLPLKQRSEERRVGKAGRTAR